MQLSLLFAFLIVTVFFVIILAVILLFMVKNKRNKERIHLYYNRYREEKKSFSNTFEQNAVGIVHLGLDGSFLKVNQKFCDIVGYSKEELQDLTFRAISLPEDLNLTLSYMKQLSDEKISTHTMEKRCIRKDRSILWVNYTLSLIRDSAGSPLFFLSIVEDITLKKQIAHELKTSEKKFHRLFNSIRDAIIMADMDRLIIDVNPAFTTLFGYLLEDVIGKPTSILYANDKDFKNTRKALKEHYGSEPFVVSVQFRDKKGEVFPGEISAHYMKDEEGNVTGFVGLVRDITERQRWEFQLKESESRYRSIFENDLTVMLLVDLESRNIIDANPACVAFSGFDFRKIIGRKVADINLTGADTISEKMKIAADKGFVTFEDRYHLSTGEVRDVYVHGVTIEIDHRKCLFLNIHDITRQKTMEKKFISAQKEAEKANRAKSVFLANMSHDIRTPMNIILGFLNLVLEDPLLSETHRKHLSTAQNSANSLLELINDILDYSKMESGKMVIENRPFILNRLIREIYETMEIKAKEKGLELKLKLTPGSDSHYPFSGSFIGDPLRIRQIIINLLGNAIKFTQKGSVSMQLIKAKEKDRIYFRIEDTGIGIPADRLSKIFNPFTQADNYTTRKFGGTGLGTTISKELVELMGGKIWAESTEGKGSTFHFTIKLTPGNQDRVQAEEAIVPETLFLQEPPRSFRILLADDVEGNVDLAKLLLEQQGHQVRVAWNGREAFELFQQGNIDLVLMDIQMPVMSGLEATKQIRALEAETEGHVPIIAMTASVMKDEKKKYFDAGMDSVVSKPIEFGKLFRIIEEVVPEGYGRKIKKTTKANLVPAETKAEITKAEITKAEMAEAKINLPLMDGIDVKKGLAAWKSPEVYLKALLKFTADYGDAAGEISHCIETGDLEKAYQIAHALKGVAGNLSVPDVFSTAEKINSLLKDGLFKQDKTDLMPEKDQTELLGSLAEALKRVVRSVNKAEYHPKKEKLPKKDLNVSELAALFREMLKAFDQFNPKAIEPFLDELSHSLFFHQLELIRKNMENYDFDAAKDETIYLATTLNIDPELLHG